MQGNRLFFIGLTLPGTLALYWLFPAIGLVMPIWLLAVSWLIFVSLLLGLDAYMESQVPTPTAAQLTLLRRWFDARRAGDRGEEQRLAELVAAEKPNYR